MSIALKIFNSNRILVVGLPSHAAASSAIEEYRMGEKEWSNWTEILAECWSSSNSSSNIRNGFKAAGLWLATRYWILWQDYPCSLLRQGLKGSFRGVNLEVSAVRCSWNQSILQGEFMAMQIYMSIKQRKKWLKLGKICWESPIQILNETDRIDKQEKTQSRKTSVFSSAARPREKPILLMILELRLLMMKKHLQNWNKRNISFSRKTIKDFMYWGKWNWYYPDLSSSLYRWTFKHYEKRLRIISQMGLDLCRKWSYWA